MDYFTSISGVNRIQESNRTHTHKTQEGLYEIKEESKRGSEMDTSNNNKEQRKSLDVKTVIEKYYFTNDDTGEIILPKRRYSSSSSGSSVEVVDEYSLDVLSPYDQTENLAYAEENPAESRAINDAIADFKNVMNKSAATNRCEENGSEIGEDYSNGMCEECSSPSEMSAYSFHSTKTENTEKTAKMCETILKLTQKIRPFQAMSPLTNFNTDKILQDAVRSESGYFSGNSGILERHDYIRGDIFANTFGNDYTSTSFTQVSRRPQMQTSTPLSAANTFVRDSVASGGYENFPSPKINQPVTLIPDPQLPISDSTEKPMDNLTKVSSFICMNCDHMFTSLKSLQQHKIRCYVAKDNRPPAVVGPRRSLRLQEKRTAEMKKRYGVEIDYTMAHDSKEVLPIFREIERLDDRRKQTIQPQHICGLCLRTYKFKGRLQIHLRLHLKYICTLCSMSFGLKNLYKTHVRRCEKLAQKSYNLNKM